jgi:hypothetical protein
VGHSKNGTACAASSKAAGPRTKAPGKRGPAYTMIRVPTGRTALDSATLLPACRKSPLTPVLYSDAIAIFSGVPAPQCARPDQTPRRWAPSPGGYSLTLPGASIAAAPALRSVSCHALRHRSLST